MVDPVIDKEIQNLIDNDIGDTQRLEFIQKSLREEKKLFNSDQKYLISLIAEHSKVENILERFDYLNPKPVKKSESKKQAQSVYKNQKYCAICEKNVFPERDFSTGALLILLLLGIIPGLIYYAVKNKTCPICKHDQWEVSPHD